MSTAPASIASPEAQACVDLFLLELGTAKTALRHRFVLHAIVMCSLALGLGLVGVAALLWAVSPPQHIHAAWMLPCVPMPPLILAWLCWRASASRALSDAALFEQLRQRLLADHAQLTRRLSSLSLGDWLNACSTPHLADRPGSSEVTAAGAHAAEVAIKGPH